MLTLGVILGISASICSNFGNIQQKYAFNHEITTTEYWSNKRWIFGFVLNVLGSLLDLIALANITQSILGPLSAFGLVSNIIFARYYLNEQINKNQVVATFLIISGTIIIVTFGNHSHVDYTIENTVAFFIRPSFLIYFGLCIFILTCIYFIILRLNLELDTITKNPQSLELTLTYLPNKSIHPILICGLSGMLGGYSILFGKICSELVSSSIVLNSFQFFGADATNSIFGTTVIILLIFCIVFQQKTLAIALKYFNASLVIPIFQCFFIISSIVNGAIYFQELSSLNIIELFLFLFGSWLTLVGIFILSIQSSLQSTLDLSISKETDSV